MKEQENLKPTQKNPVISEIISVRKKSEEKLFSEENNKKESETFLKFLNSFIDSNFDKRLEKERPASHMDRYGYNYVSPYKCLDVSVNFGEDKDIKFKVIKLDNATVINFKDLDYRITIGNQKIEKVSKKYKESEFNEHTIIGGPGIPARPLWEELAKPEEIQGYMDLFKKIKEKTDVEYKSTWYMS